MIKLVVLLMFAIASQVYAEPEREITDATKRDHVHPEQRSGEPNSTIRVSASPKGSAVTFTIDLADDFFSGGPTKGFETLDSSHIEGPDFQISLRTLPSTPKQIVFVLPRVMLKGLVLVLSIHSFQNQGSLPPRRSFDIRRIELESLLNDSLGTKNKEQPGTIQPATKPADKPPANDQPLTPTSEVSPR